MTNLLYRSAAMAALLALQPFAVAELSAAVSSQAVPGAAPSTRAPETAPTTQAGNGDGKKICRAETPTGSIRPVRVCRTRAEWVAEAQQGQANKDQLDTNRMRQQQLQSSHG